MNRAPLQLLALALGATLAAQTPQKPPPWWNVPDEVTVSLYYDFSGLTPFEPTTAVVPSWYNPTVTAFTLPPNAVISQVGGHADVLTLTGAPQTALIKLQVDNDPHLDWVKIFWFQFEAFQGAAGGVKQSIEQDLAQYKRTIVSETSVSLGGGWDLITIEAQLMPQPGDETVDWTLTQTALASVGIDNLFVSSKCVKPQPDEDGDAMGLVVGQTAVGTLNGFDSVGVAVTEGPAPLFQKRTWVSQRQSAGPHTVIQIGTGGIVTTTPLPATAALAPRGPMDMAVETITSVGGTQQILYVLTDQRPSLGRLEIHGINANTGALLGPPIQLVFAVGSGLQNLGLGADIGLAFDPSGDQGAGTFWISATNQANVGLLVEFRRNGAQIPGVQGLASPLPRDCSGLGYDDALGSFYAFSQSPLASPSGPVQVNGFEISAYDFTLTGNRFCGDLTIPNGLAGPRGGVARGLEVYRSRSSPTSELRIVCLVEANGSWFVRELAGPFGFGWSQFGRCKMRGGVPFLGSNSFQVALTGVPNALFGMMYLGFSNTNYLGLPLPLPLSSIGMLESSLSISLDVSGPLMPPLIPGEFTQAVTIPPAPALGYAPIFFQWILLDPNVPGFMAASQAGKTVIYP